MTDRFIPKMDAATRAAQLRQEAAGPGKPDTADDVEFEVSEEPQAYSMISADRQRKIMVEFRTMDGNAKALSYSYLVSIDFNASEGIAMDFSGYTVTISGRNLRPIFDGLVSQRIAVVRETDEFQADASFSADGTVVTKIEIKPVE